MYPVLTHDLATMIAPPFQHPVLVSEPAAAIMVGPARRRDFVQWDLMSNLSFHIEPTSGRRFHEARTRFTT